MLEYKFRIKFWGGGQPRNKISKNKGKKLGKHLVLKCENEL